MTFTVGTITRCAGLGHWTFPVTIGAQTRPVETTKDELDFDPIDDFAATVTLRERILWRIRSAILEAGASTLPQIRAAVEGKTFRV